jgi:penicillin-binding protein 1A
MAKKKNKHPFNPILSTGFIRFILKWSITLGIWGVLFIGVLTGFFAYDLPSTDKALEVSRRPAITLLANDGTKIADLGDFQGVALDAKDLPTHLIQAVIATEDRRFYTHSGVDIVGISRAVIRNIKAGRVVQGGSTLSQQAAKNLFLTSARTYKRKYQELILAFWLEYKFTKEQILSIYLNRVYLGSGTYGVDGAARKYFGVSARELTVFQAAIIAGLLKAPSKLNPRNNIKAALARGKVVLSNMVEAGYITKSQAIRASKSKILYAKNQESSKYGRHFVDWISRQIRGFIGPQMNDITVKTTLNLTLQAQAEKLIETYIAQHLKRYKMSQAAVIVMTPEGAILAMVGGRDYSASQFNRSTQSLRQPGSAFKPIVYLAAIEAGLLPESKFKDSMINIDGWSPKNYDGKFNGEMTLKQAFARSINTIAVKVSEYVGRSRIITTAKRMGITAPLTMSPSLPLGTSGISLIELTGAYAVLANNGKGTLPYGISEIKDQFGRLQFKRQGDGAGQIIKPQNIRAMDDMMSEVIQSGTGKKARLNVPAKGKTGTSQSFRDAWFIGYTRKFVTGVWVGNDDDTPMKKVTGGGFPALIWRQIMSYAHSGIAKKTGFPVIKSTTQTPKKSLWDKFIGSFLSSD